MSKPILIYGFPRSGSTMFSEMMIEICTKQNIFLNEFFNPRFKVIQTNPIKIKYDRSIIIPEGMSGKTMMDIIKKKKFNQLIKEDDPGKYLMKVFSIHLDNYSYMFDWLNDNYKFICIERKKLDIQVVSFLLSIYTDTWVISTENEQQIYNNLLYDKKIIAQKNDVIRISRQLTEYYENKHNIKNLMGTIYYEDFINNWEKSLNQFDIEVPKDYKFVTNLKKQNFDHYDSFENKDELKKWCASLIKPIENLV